MAIGLLIAAVAQVEFSAWTTHPASTGPITEASVLCTPANTTFHCTVGKFDAVKWTARAMFTASGNATGWSTINVESNKEATDAAASFAAGYVEGYLTSALIDLEWLNLEQQTTLSPKMREFILANNAWARSQAATFGDDYWKSVGHVYSQFDGIVAGYQSSPSKHFKTSPLNAMQILLIGLVTELGDIQSAVEPSKRPKFDQFTHEQLTDYIFTHSHCSAMIKVLPDLSELYAAHNTWFAYEDMGLRIWKVYNLPLSTAKAHTVSFPGYPAKIAGIDDFYVTSQKLTVIETTNNVFDTSLFDHVTPSTVPYWVRVTVANRLASNGPDWHEAFYKFNSGTYNNQWMTVDYKLFTPKQPLLPNTLYVSEQIPGYYQSGDQTMVLQRGHWPSYNVAFYDDIYSMSGYPQIVKQFGASQSYQLAPRAPIFRRDADGMVHDLPSMQTFMRLNKFNMSDPLMPSPESAIAARGDLMPGGHQRAAGAYDGKITSHALIMKDLGTTAIAGPTANDQPVFSWTGAWADMKKYPHWGHPERFEFEWEVFTVA